MADITPEELKERIDNGEKLNIIDVREEYENEEFNIGGNVIPLGTLQSALTELENLNPTDKSTVNVQTTCNDSLHNSVILKIIAVLLLIILMFIILRGNKKVNL